MIMEKVKVGVASDHAGFDMKEFLTGYLSSKGISRIRWLWPWRAVTWHSV